ncbi:hypothetical protein ACS0TY_005514 [Phlomoides rotata]
MKWILEGDVNSGYFHGWINKRRKANEIDGLFFDEVWTDSVEGVKNGGGRGVCYDIQKVIGNGEGTDFWKDVWVGEVALCEKFNRLYRISSQQESSVGGMGECEESGWK